MRPCAEASESAVGRPPRTATSKGSGRNFASARRNLRRNLARLPRAGRSRLDRLGKSDPGRAPYLPVQDAVDAACSCSRSRSRSRPRYQLPPPPHSSSARNMPSAQPDIFTPFVLGGGTIQLKCVQPILPRPSILRTERIVAWTLTSSTPLQAPCRHGAAHPQPGVAEREARAHLGAQLSVRPQLARSPDSRRS